jgi:hypothetical protein
MLARPVVQRVLREEGYQPQKLGQRGEPIVATTT